MSGAAGTGGLVRLAPSRWHRRIGAQLALGVVIVGCLLLVALLGPIVSARDPMDGDIMARLRPWLTQGFVLGSDQLGRDILARIIAGFPWSLGIAASATALALAIGTTLGMLAAWSEGWLRAVLNKTVDLVIAFPALVIAVSVIAVVGRGFWPLALTLGLVSWPVIARVVYAESRGLIQRDYVLAARLVGASAPRILVGHVLPGLRPTLLVMLAFHFADMLIAESALSFLGLGAPLAAPTWGNMLSESRQYMFNAPWMLLAPGLVIVSTVVGLNLIGDGIAARARGRARAVE